MEYVKLKKVANYPTGKLNSNAACENGLYPFFTCSHEIFKIDSYAYDGEYVLLGGNNATGDFPIFYYNGKFEAYQRTYLIQPIDKEKHSTRYLYYAIGEKLSLMQKNASGTATKFLTKPILDNITIPDFSIDKQRTIASILSAYDNLIENNNRRIRLLEQMAENLYKEWFVRFRFPGHEKAEFENGLPKGWTNSPLSTICEFKRGKNITSEEMCEGTIPVISAGVDVSGYHNEPNVKGVSITMSSSGANAGYISIHYSDIWAADCSYLEEHTTPNIFYVYELLNNMRTVITNFQRGAAQPHVYPKDINRIKLIIPDNNIMDKANKQFALIHKEIFKLEKQSTLLSRQRDLLLPRLMSGKLEVKVE